jgi:uncharacterized sodium:solute symporter family permease YidK
LFIISHTITLLALFALELAPNKYLANAFVLVKTWAALQATIFGAALLTFKSKLPSPSTINWALEITKPAKKKTLLQRFLRSLYRTQPGVVAIVALLFGEWIIMISYALFLAFMYKIQPAATEYLKGMHIDIDKKSAVIDV